MSVLQDIVDHQLTQHHPATGGVLAAWVDPDAGAVEVRVDRAYWVCDRCEQNVGRSGPVTMIDTSGFEHHDFADGVLNHQHGCGESLEPAYAAALIVKGEETDPHGDFKPSSYALIRDEAIDDITERVDALILAALEQDQHYRDAADAQLRTDLTWILGSDQNAPNADVYRGNDPAPRQVGRYGNTLIVWDMSPWNDDEPIEVTSPIHRTS